MLDAEAGAAITAEDRGNHPALAAVAVDVPGECEHDEQQWAAGEQENKPAGFTGSGSKSSAL